MSTGIRPLVSVCIQTYRHFAYIKECLDSVLCQQTDFPFEIILGEDGSDDGTREICEDYAIRYPGIIRLFLRSEKDKIYIDGEKTGRFNFIENLKAARGKYIALLDGDDYWLSTHKLQKQADYMEANPDCNVSFHKTKQWVNKGKLQAPPSLELEVNSKFTINEIVSLVNVLTIHTSNCMFLRSSIKEIPSWFYQVPFLDVPLFIHCGSGGSVGFIAETLSVYRIHGSGMWLSGREPGNYIKMWRLFTIMTRNINGEMKHVLMDRRSGIGAAMIKFYKNHLWENSEWLEKELEQNEFPGDDILYRDLCMPPALKDYFFNAGSFAKEIIRRSIKKLR